jgi:hypothetical protein
MLKRSDPELRHPDRPGCRRIEAKTLCAQRQAVFVVSFAAKSLFQGD